MDNVINKTGDKAIGYYDDLAAGLTALAHDALNDKNYDLAAVIADELGLLEQHKDYEGLLVINEHDGTHITISKYEE